MNRNKEYYYTINSGQLDESEIKTISGNISPEKVKLIYFYLQYKAFEDITYDIVLAPKDLANLLVDYYGFKEERLVLINKETYDLNLLNIWNELILQTELPLYCDDINSESECKLIDIYNSYSKDFIFINASLKLPKWAFEQVLDPLTMHVTHNGVLIQGIDMIAPEYWEKISMFYKKVISCGREGIFFDFDEFPPYKYSFRWDGRHILICEVKEYEDAPTQVLREMKIGHFLTSKDLKQANLRIKDFEVLKRKMRLI